MTGPEPTGAHQRLREHLQRFWPDATIRDLTWPVGPILQSQPDFRVACVQPSGPRQPWVYASSGASARHTRDGHLEFFIISPVEDVLHVQTLAMVTNFALDPRYEVHLGRILEIGEPWLPGSRCDHLLVSLPYPYGPELEALDLARAMHLLWLLPITREEADFGKQHGVEALEQCFERDALDYLDLHRGSVRLRLPNE